MLKYAEEKKLKQEIDNLLDIYNSCMFIYRLTGEEHYKHRAEVYLKNINNPRRLLYETH